MLQQQLTLLIPSNRIGRCIAEATQPEPLPVCPLFPAVARRESVAPGTRPKQNKIWLWTAVNHFNQGILAWVLGNRSAETFKRLWQVVKRWKSYFYVTDGRGRTALVYYDSYQQVCNTASENRSFKYGFRSTRGIFKENAV